MAFQGRVEQSLEMFVEFVDFKGMCDQIRNIPFFSGQKLVQLARRIHNKINNLRLNADIIDDTVM